VASDACLVRCAGLMLSLVMATTTMVATLNGPVALAATGARVQLDARPQTIPALQKWTPGKGPGYVLPSRLRIVVGHVRNPALLPTARQLAATLRSRYHRKVTLVRADRQAPGPRKGDVVLRFRADDKSLGREGYQLTSGSRLLIGARTVTGVFYGTRTLLQLLRQATTVPRGQTRDGPRLRERALGFDLARRPLSATWMIKQIQRMSYLKLNILRLHLTDDQGWAYRSAVHPELSTPRAWTRHEIASVLAAARRNHIRVIPEVDMPGHMKRVIAGHPDWALRDFTGKAAGSTLDVTNPAVFAFARDITRELSNLFPTGSISLGGDEIFLDGTSPHDAILVAQAVATNSHTTHYLPYPSLAAYAQKRYGAGANGGDAILGFMNDVARPLQKSGTEVRMWNDHVDDGSAVRLDRRIVIDFWDDHIGADPGVVAELGHPMMNASAYPGYVDAWRSGDDAASPDLKMAYENWVPDTFHGAMTVEPFRSGGTQPTTAPGTKLEGLGAQLRGGQVTMWNNSDPAATVGESVIAARVLPSMRLMAQKTWWSAPLFADYESFAALGKRLGVQG